MPPGPDWRFLITELGPPLGTGENLTLLAHLPRSREILKTLDMGSVAKFEVPSDSPEVKRPNSGTDSDPFLSYNNRLLYALRREDQPGLPPWKCRFAGTIMQLEDEAQADQGTTHATAFDPWQMLMGRPLTLANGKLATNGMLFNAPGQPRTTLDQIALQILENTDVAHGSCWIDYGQTGIYSPVIETCAAPEIELTQGISVGEAWTQLCDTGGIDIVLTPIYDPGNRPGFLAELRIYVRTGSPRYSAVFGWDKPTRSLVGVNRLHDGTTMANKVLYFKSGGQPVQLQTDAASVAKYGQYWLQQSVTDQAGTRAVELFALAELLLRRRGKMTLTIDPVPERSPVPFLDYKVGDLVPVYASDNLRQPIESDAFNPYSLPGLWRVYALPLSIDDNGVETVKQILLTNPSTAI